MNIQLSKTVFCTFVILYTFTLYKIYQFPTPVYPNPEYWRIYFIFVFGYASFPVVNIGMQYVDKLLEPVVTKLLNKLFRKS